MPNKIMIFAAAMLFALPAIADETEIVANDIIPAPVQSVAAVSDISEFNADGSVFLRITELEQEKVLMRLEKEKAQLELEFERIEAERQRLTGQQEQNAASAAADIKAEMEAERNKLSEELSRFARQLEEVKEEISKAKTAEPAPAAPQQDMAKPAAAAPAAGALSEVFRIVGITGRDNNLSATIENMDTGARRKVQAGKTIDGFVVESISAEQGVVLSADGETFTIGVM